MITITMPLTDWFLNIAFYFVVGVALGAVGYHEWIRARLP